MATRTDQSGKKGNVLWPCQHQRAARTCPKFHLVGQVLRGGRRLTPSPGGNPAPCSQWDMQEGGTGILLPWLPFLSSQDAPDYFRLGDHTEEETAIQEPLSSAALELKAPLGLQPRLTDSSLFPERVWMEHRWTPKIPDCPDLRQRNGTAANTTSAPCHGHGLKPCRESVSWAPLFLCKAVKSPCALLR